MTHAVYTPGRRRDHHLYWMLVLPLSVVDNSDFFPTRLTAVSHGLRNEM